jgi:hypothetical protein
LHPLVGQEQAVNLTLGLQSAQQSIEVEATQTLVQTEPGNQVTSYSQDYVKNTPVNGGDITNVAFTTPGIRLNVGGGNANFNVNGLPFNSVLFTMNGADIVEPYNLNNNQARAITRLVQTTLPKWPSSRTPIAPSTVARRQSYILAHVPALSLPIYQSLFKLYNMAPGVGPAMPVTNGNLPLQDSSGHLGCGKQTFIGRHVNGTSGPQFGVDTSCAVAFGTTASSINT